jgi:hypothetical protein
MKKRKQDKEIRDEWGNSTEWWGKFLLCELNPEGRKEPACEDLGDPSVYSEQHMQRACGKNELNMCRTKKQYGWSRVSERESGRKKGKRSIHGSIMRISVNEIKNRVARGIFGFEISNVLRESLPPVLRIDYRV